MFNNEIREIPIKDFSYYNSNNIISIKDPTTLDMKQ